MENELKIALIQSSLVWENPEKNREHFSKKLDSINKEVDLVILPEMFTTAFTMNPWNIAKEEGEETVKWMQKEAERKNVALAGSMVYFDNGHYYNRLWFVEPDGKSIFYDKRHTFTLAGEDKVYNKGEKRIVINFKGFRICPLICYDLRFPVWARNREDYDVLIYVANWPQPRINAWDALLKARAIENMAYVIGVN
ncbi:MAG: nitrilase-related carbon-nitrogen hydrolase, partial [Arenibacter sp.]